MAVKSVDKFHGITTAARLLSIEEFTASDFGIPLANFLPAGRKGVVRGEVS